MGRLFEALVWSLAGFVLGWVSCRIMAQVVDEDEEAPNVEARFEKVRVVIGILILLMITVTGVQYYRVTSCQTNYNDQVADALAQRSDAQRVETKSRRDSLVAQKVFLQSLTQDQATNQQETQKYLHSLDDQMRALDDLERTRQQNPLPHAPDCSSF